MLSTSVTVAIMFRLNKKLMYLFIDKFDKNIFQFIDSFIKKEF